MKSVLKVSLLLNLGLSACLIFILAIERREPAVTTPRAGTDARPPAPATVAPAHTAMAGQSSRPFHWNELESTNDYRVYVANLRAIGCPEPTVQDIVRGDADRGFSFERNQLGLDGSGTGKWSRLYEAQTVASLLGEPLPVAETGTPPQNTPNPAQPADGSTIAEAPPGTQGTVQDSENSDWAQSAIQQPLHRAAVTTPAYPLVFQNVNSDTMGLNDSQKAAIQQLQQQFVNDIGGSSQDPSNPAYLASWQNAQNNADNMLLINVGWQIYSKYQIMAWQNSLK